MRHSVLLGPRTVASGSHSSSQYALVVGHNVSSDDSDVGSVFSYYQKVFR